MWRAIEIFSLLLILYLMAIPKGHAEFEPAQLVNESCDQVKSEFEKLPALDRQNLVEYAALVVKLPAPSAPVIEVGSNSPVSPLTVKDTSNLNVWSLFDPKRESAIRRCALWILDQSRPSSAVFLAELGELAESKSLLIIEAKLQQELLESAFRIADDLRARSEKMRSQPFVAESVSKLVTELEQTNSFYAKALLISLGELSVNKVVDSLKSEGTKALPQKLQILRAIDPSGKLSGKEIVQIFVRQFKAKSESADLVYWVQHVASLESYFVDVLPAITPALVTGEREKFAYSFLETSAAGRTPSSSSVPLFPRSTVADLVKELGSADAAQFKTLERFFSKYTLRIPDLESNLTRLLAEEKDPTKLGRLAGLSASLFPAGQKTFGALLNLLENTDLGVRIEVIHSLGRFTSRSQQAQTHLFKLLTRTASLQSLALSDRIEMAAAVAHSLIALQSNTAAQSVASVLFDFIELGSNNGAPEKSLSALEDVVSNCGNSVRPMLAKRVAAQTDSFSFRAAKILAKLRPVEQPNLDILLDYFASAKAERRIEISDLLSSLLAEIPDSLRNIAQKRLVKIVNSNDAALATSSAVLLLLLESREKKIYQFDFWKDRLQSLSYREGIDLLQHRDKIVIPPAVQISLIADRLTDKSSGTISKEALNLANEIRDGRLADSLRLALDSSAANDPQRIPGMLLLAKLDQKTYDLPKILISELVSSSETQRARIAAQIPGSILLKLLSRLLHDSNPEMRILGLSIVPKSAEMAAALFADIANLLEDSEIAVRNAADATAARLYKYLDKEFAAGVKLMVKSKIYNGFEFPEVEDFHDVLSDLLVTDTNVFSTYSICSALPSVMTSVPGSRCFDYFQGHTLIAS